MSKLARLIQAGFDLSEKRGPYLRVKCSQCEAAVINGVACHEPGCRNWPRMEQHDDV